MCVIYMCYLFMCGIYMCEINKPMSKFVSVCMIFIYVRNEPMLSLYMNNM